MTSFTLSLLRTIELLARPKLSVATAKFKFARHHLRFAVPMCPLAAPVDLRVPRLPRPGCRVYWKRFLWWVQGHLNGRRCTLWIGVSQRHFVGSQGSITPMMAELICRYPIPQSAHFPSFARTDRQCVRCAQRKCCRFERSESWA